MAISVNYATKVIYVPRADLVEIQSVPSYVYQLNMEWFWLQLKDLEDNSDGMAVVDTVLNNPPVNVGGVVLARVVQIINGFFVEFEDGQYAVNLTGANTNLQDVAVVNQVSIRPNNSAGLQDLSTLLQAAYANTVCVDVVNGQAGTVIPLGTRGTPVNNFDDALVIAANNSLRNIQLMSSATISSGDFSAGYRFVGDSEVIVTLTLDPGANIEHCTFETMTIQGTMDGENTFKMCNILDVTYVNGFIFQCALNGTITIGGGAQCSILDCWSNIAGAGPGAYPSVDMGGSGNSLVVRNFSGGLGLKNYAGGGNLSLDMESGRVVVESTVTDGVITVRGIADIEDNSTGTAVVDDQTVNESMNILQLAIDYVRKLLANRAVVANDDSTSTIYDDDKVTPLLVHNHPSARERDPQ